MFIKIFLLCLVVSNVYPQNLNYQNIIQDAESRVSKSGHKQYVFITENRANDDGTLRTLYGLKSLVKYGKENLRSKIPSTIDVTAVNDVMSQAYVSNSCMEHINVILQWLNDTEDNWAFRFLDSFGKIESGIYDGNIKWYGSYDECLSIRGLEYNVTNPTEIFEGQYCLLGTPFSTSRITIGLCSPDSCSTSDVQQLLIAAVSAIHPNLTTPLSVECHPKNVDLDDKAIGAIALFGFILLCVLVGTLFDILVIQIPQWMDKEDVKNEKVPLLDKPKSKEKQGDIYKDGVLSKVLLSFSVYTNGKKILNTDLAEGSLTAVNGIRFLSMSWVILGHTYGYITNIADNPNTFLTKMLKRWTFQGIANATVSVDSFFTLSGLLLAYLFLRGRKKTHGKMNWAMFYFHRFWRLTPVYMLVLFAEVALTRYFTDGPMWPKETGFENEFCKDTWWTNMLYINNFVKSDKMCMGWSWYLANDMQFFVISPLLLVPLFYSTSIGLIICFMFLLATLITTGVISTHYNLSASNYVQGLTTQQRTDHFQEYYIKPYTRIGPYIVGIITGYFLYRTENGFRMNKIISLVGWTLATGAVIIVVYGLYDAVNDTVTLSVEVSALYNAVHRTVWGACLCWVIFACAHGYGGFVNTLLSWKGFIPLSRLTYCAYLVHPITMYTVYYSSRDTVYITDISMLEYQRHGETVVIGVILVICTVGRGVLNGKEIVYKNVFYFFGNMVGAYAAAFVVSLCFESPMMGLEKAIFHSKKKL